MQRARGDGSDDDNGSRSRPVQARLERRRGLRLQAQEGPLRRDRSRDVGHEGRARLDARLPPEGAQAVHGQAHGAVVRGQHARPRFRQHLLLREADRGSGAGLGRAARLHQVDLREAGHPRGGTEVPRRCDRPVRERGRLPPQPGRPRVPGRPVLRHGHGGARVPRAGEAMVRDDHPPQRQQVRRTQLGGVVGRVVHLRPARGEGRHAAAGVLPDQHREHGPVRADLDHRGRGFRGSLRGRVLGAGVHHGLSPLGRGRAGGAAGLAHHVHHHPELVEQRLQPRDQAGACRSRGPRGLDRRQHRVASRP